MSQSVHVTYIVADTVVEETHTGERVTYQNWDGGRAIIKIHNPGRVESVSYRRAERIHRATDPAEVQP